MSPIKPGLIVLAFIVATPTVICQAQENLPLSSKIEMRSEKKPLGIFYYTEIRTIHEGDLIEQKTVNIQAEGLASTDGREAVQVPQYTLQNVITTTETRNVSRVSRIPVIGSLFKTAMTTTSTPVAGPIIINGNQVVDVTTRVKR